MKKVFLFVAFVATLVLPQFAKAQNVQVLYDFGSVMYDEDKAPGLNPATLTTVEHFKADKYGSTFFFIDMKYKDTGIQSAYWEIFRNLRYWNAPIDLHLEYNGGVLVYNQGKDLMGVSLNNCFLLGASYSYNAKDFSYGFSLTPSYKYIAKSNKPHQVQLTGAWYSNFLDGKLSFNGFFDLWTQDFGAGTKTVFLSQPQLWLNLNKLQGVPSNLNLSVGGELEISYNFPVAHEKSFYAVPRLGLKYTL